MALYELSADAQQDLRDIWSYIAADSIDLANRIEEEFYAVFQSLGEMPGQGHTRKDLTNRPVLFFPLYSYLVIYQPEVKPIRIMAVLRGKRDVKRILEARPERKSQEL